MIIEILLFLSKHVVNMIVVWKQTDTFAHVGIKYLQNVIMQM